MTTQQMSPDEPTAFRPPEDQLTLAPLQLTPGTILGTRYRIVSLIGSGGMGQVYRADDLKLGQTVALKFLARHGDARRLHDEVRIGRQISHPNVCRLYDIADFDGQLFITMEFVDGEDLASLLRRVGRLPSEKALAVTRDICAGVAAAHEKGVMHRDLKPANVMIDGRGRARVTDFGLAVAGERAQDGAGTPAYMAPEQLAGEAAVIKSDIFALGLVIYELFTGKRAYESTRRGEFTRPSSITKDVPAAIERLIERCLDPDPDARPDAVDLLRQIPGDPLAAAIAAGETPSPAMVAAASDRGDLSVVAAVALLATVGITLLLYALLTPRTMLYRRVPMKSPEVLRERVGEVLRATNQPLRRADWSAQFAMDMQWILRRKGSTADPSIVYLYRQSPQPLSAQNFERRVLTNDPPLVDSGMADVVLDSEGNLRRLTVVPPQYEQPPATTVDVDWKPLIAMTGVKGPLKPVDAGWWAGVVDTDQKRAWAAPDGTTIQLASYHGKPVWLDVLKPWATPWRMDVPTEVTGSIVAAAGLTMTVAFMSIGILLAVRNLRRGRGDRRGARRVALFTALVSFAASMLLAHHTALPWDELYLLVSDAGVACVSGGMTWIGYVAIEPLIRRRWPHMLISESRLIAGLFRDPMVGRDVLVGVAIGLSLMFVRELAAVLPGASAYQSANLALTSIRYVVWFLGGALMLAAYGPIIGATLLVGFHALTRNLRVTMALLAVLGGGFMIGDVVGPMWARVIFALITAVAVLLMLFRFGLLAYSAAVFTYVFLRRMPITLDTADWFFGRSAFALAVVFALAFYGFIVSLAGKRWLPEMKVD
jgi:hypothetical protein